MPVSLLMTILLKILREEYRPWNCDRPSGFRHVVSWNLSSVSANTAVAIFWMSKYWQGYNKCRVVASCSLVVGYERFGGLCCLHLHGCSTTILHGATTQKITNSIFTAVKISNLPSRIMKCSQGQMSRSTVWHQDTCF